MLALMKEREDETSWIQAWRCRMDMNLTILRILSPRINVYSPSDGLNVGTDVGLDVGADRTGG
jgi:hypothetical protein